jgi:hypothetical protein
MDSDDLLKSMESQIADASVTSTPVAYETPAEMQEVAPSRGNVRGSLSALPDTAKDWALKDMPQGWRERIVADAADFGIKTDGDAAWLLVGSYVRAWAAAAAAGEFAKEIDAGVGKIQGQILAGAMKAGNSIQKDMAHVIAKGGEALLASIAEAANAGAKRVEAGSKDLVGKLDAAVESKKAEGVSAFARAASEAAIAASTAAARTVISETKIKLRRSATGMAVIFLIYAGIGGGVAVEYLSLTHRIAPHALVLTASGKPNCGEVTIGESVQEVCQIR